MKYKGFTLLELLIALAIFSVISYVSFTAVRNLSYQGGILLERQQELSGLQLVVAVIENDLLQITPRTIRDQDGVVNEAMRTTQNGGLEFSRTNKFLGFNKLNSDIQRIGYVLEDDKLYRINWQHLDRALDDVGSKQLLIEGVEDFSFEFLNSDDEWVAEWPVALPGGSNTRNNKTLPRMISFVIRMQNALEISRLLPGVSP